MIFKKMQYCLNETSLESMAVLEKIFRVQESYFRVHRVLKFQKNTPGASGALDQAHLAHR